MESSCIFYTSKYHLGMILMEYLMNKNTDDFLVKLDLENKINQEINVLKEKYYSKKNIVMEEIDELKKQIKSNTIFVIEGDIQQTEAKSEKIKNIAKKNNCKNIEILKCFDFNKYSNSMNIITQKNNQILMTSGKKVID